MAVLALSFSLLLAVLAMFEILENKGVDEWAQSDVTMNRLAGIKLVLENIRDEGKDNFIATISRCHEGYIVSEEPFSRGSQSEQTRAIATQIAKALALSSDSVRVRTAQFTSNDFSYRNCVPSEMKFPLDGMVISLQTAPNEWLNAEIHPHEWHFTPTMTGWLVRSVSAFILVGGMAFLFVRRLSNPINNLTNAAKSFGSELMVAEVEEIGPPDVKRAIRSFNAMQREVSNEVKRRSNTLAAISHDVRSPLTALRLKAELVDDDEVRADLINSVAKMERITASALEFLKGESRAEPKRQVDLGALVESECADFRELGAAVSFTCLEVIQYSCRPEALARAVRNVVENAVKYAGAADVVLKKTKEHIEIVVSDCGPGIPTSKLELVLEPFERLSAARESGEGGFGFGLAIAKAVTEGHEGIFELRSNSPRGLIATLRLPLH